MDMSAISYTLATTRRTELFAERMQNIRKQKQLEARKKAEEEKRERERLANLRERT